MLRQCLDLRLQGTSCHCGSRVYQISDQYYARTSVSKHMCAICLNRSIHKMAGLPSDPEVEGSDPYKFSKDHNLTLKGLAEKSDFLKSGVPLASKPLGSSLLYMSWFS